jgi:predicted RNA binding protein YcfA (HicA-like mRNA interferase family)
VSPFPRPAEAGEGAERAFASEAGEGCGGGALLRDSRDIIARLLREGFEEKSSRGSHRKFVHPQTKRQAIVPHPKRDLPRGTVGSINKQAGWPKD